MNIQEYMRRGEKPTMKKFTTESTTHFVQGTVCRWNIQKMQSESRDDVRKNSGLLHKQLENQHSLGELLGRACEGSLGERVDELQTTLLHTYPPKLTATILKALREHLEENDQLNAVEETAGPAPNIPLEYDQILKERRRFWDDVNGGSLPRDLVLTIT